MNEKLLMQLSNADAIASDEQQVRSILVRELSNYCDEIRYDALGSVMFHKRGKGEKPLRVAFYAHMDEVGFKVRSISDIGFLYLMPIGGVRKNSCDMQAVRVTTATGQVLYGVLNSIHDDSGNIKESYVDVGTSTAEETLKLGIQIGDMVCFDSTARKLTESVYAGKAMDDRTGCYILAQAAEQIENSDNDIWFVGTSSEEVGVRGSKISTNIIHPDVVFALDVANAPELVRDHTNHRILGAGPMCVVYDKTLAPNKKLIRFVNNLCQKAGIPYQEDMLKGGGTDAGNAALEDGGCLAMVLGIPLRYCHGSWSLADIRDLESLIQLVKNLAVHLTREDYESFINY